MKALKLLAIGDLLALRALLEVHLQDCADAHRAVGCEGVAHEEIDQKAEVWKRLREKVYQEILQREVALCEELRDA
jgi:hypothetical protein